MIEWHVYNSLTGEQKILGEKELQEFLPTVGDDLLAYTFVWKDGFKDWEPLAKFPELLAMRKKAPAPPPRGMRAPVLPDELSLEIADSSLIVPAKAETTNTGDVNRRQSERLPVQLNVIITVDNTVIRTTTSDISETGISLEDQLPTSMLRKPIQLYISSPDSKQKLKMTATLVGDPKDARRFKFNAPTQQQVDQIRALLQSVRLINTKAS